MGKKKYNLKKKSLRENAEFDMMEAGDESLAEAKIKNKPMIISSKKAKKKAQKSFLKASSLNKALNTMDTMEDVVQQKGKNLGQGWHRVTLANAAKFNKEIVLQSLVNGSPQAFTPVCFTKNNADYSFYVESPSVATALKSLDRKISVTQSSQRIRAQRKSLFINETKTKEEPLNHGCCRPKHTKDCCIANGFDQEIA